MNKKKEKKKENVKMLIGGVQFKLQSSQMVVFMYI